MEAPLLYRQLQDQLSQWVQPKDQRHLQGLAEIVAVVLQSGNACLGRWIPYLSHRHWPWMSLTQVYAMLTA